jgi:acyl-CoA thioesterase I
MWLFILLGLTFSPLALAKTILVVGDSLTEGYGLESTDAFPAHLERLLRRKFPDVKVINGGVSGSTTASAEQRVKWFAKAKPEVIIFSLGANDGLRGVAVRESRKNLERAIQAARGLGMRVLLTGMKLPLNYGKPYRQEFEAMYTSLSTELRVPLLPFLLEGVGGVPAMNQADGIHPNKAGHQKIAQTMAQALESHL